MRIRKNSDVVPVFIAARLTSRDRLNTGKMSSSPLPHVRLESLYCRGWSIAPSCPPPLLRNLLGTREGPPNHRTACASLLQLQSIREATAVRSGAGNPAGVPGAPVVPLLGNADSIVEVVMCVQLMLCYLRNDDAPRLAETACLLAVVVPSSVVVNTRPSFVRSFVRGSDGAPERQAKCQGGRQSEKASFEAWRQLVVVQSCCRVRRRRSFEEANNVQGSDNFCALPNLQLHLARVFPRLVVPLLLTVKCRSRAKKAL